MKMVINRFMRKKAPFSTTELNQLIPRLRATLEQAEQYQKLKGGLDDLMSGSPTPRAPKLGGGKRAGAAKTPSKARSRMNPDASAKLRQRIIEHLKASKAKLGSGDIIKALKANAPAVRYGLRELRKAGKVKMQGTRNQARFFMA
jgi:hypothetical protein